MSKNPTETATKKLKEIAYLSMQIEDIETLIVVLNKR